MRRRTRDRKQKQSHLSGVKLSNGIFLARFYSFATFVSHVRRIFPIEIKKAAAATTTLTRNNGRVAREQIIDGQNERNSMLEKPKKGQILT